MHPVDEDYSQHPPRSSALTNNVQTWRTWGRFEPQQLHSNIIFPLGSALPSPVTSCRWLTALGVRVYFKQRRCEWMTREHLVTGVDSSRGGSSKRPFDDYSSTVWSPFTRYLCKWWTSVINYGCVTNSDCFSLDFLFLHTKNHLFVAAVLDPEWIPQKQGGLWKVLTNFSARMNSTNCWLRFLLSQHNLDKAWIRGYPRLLLFFLS